LDLRKLLSRIALLLRIPDSHIEGRFVLGAATTYLDALNPEQRRAVEHDVRRNDTVGQPLLIIAGAGSGKTNTLAHRVAHLIVNGADPGRILLMTFSRRAAAEMTRRVARIAAKLGRNNASVVSDSLAWAGKAAFQPRAPALRSIPAA
jgi:DNA helicase-2/ATP-dependent DNA helicase PcrA